MLHLGLGGEGDNRHIAVVRHNISDEVLDSLPNPLPNGGKGAGRFNEQDVSWQGFTYKIKSKKDRDSLSIRGSFEPVTNQGTAFEYSGIFLYDKKFIL